VGAVCAFITMPVPSRHRAERFTDPATRQMEPSRRVCVAFDCPQRACWLNGHAGS